MSTTATQIPDTKMALATSPVRRGQRAPGLGPALARSHSAARRRSRALRHLASEVGQGTVEYVGLLLLMATVLAAVVGAAKGLGGEDQIGKKVVTQVGRSIDQAGGGKPSH